MTAAGSADRTTPPDSVGLKAARTTLQIVNETS